MMCRKCSAELPENAVYCHLCGTKQDDTTKRTGKRRGNGQGTVYKRGKTWYIEKTFGFHEDGRRIMRKKGGFATKKEALAYAPFLQNPLIKTTSRNRGTDITLKGLFDLWFPTHQAAKKTLDDYRTTISKVFAPVWYVKMEDMDIDDLQECFDEYIPKKGSSGKRTKQVAKTGLGLVYKYGIPRGYVPANLAGEPNLAKFLVIHGDESPQKEGFPTEVLEQIKNAVFTVPYADYIYCACYLGFRPSAMLELDVKDYNRQERALNGGIKTEAGIGRTVTVSPKIQPIIDRLVTDKIAGPLFSRENGEKLSIRDYRSKFYVALETIGIENPINEYGVHKYTPHSCRHTFATLMKKVKAPEKDKLELIGHTSEEMLRYYQDVSYDDLRRITDAI